MRSVFNTHTRIADDRFLVLRFASISAMIDATDVFFIFAIRCNSVINSGSSEMLVWCPDKDTDIFFIICHPSNNHIMHGMGRRIFVIQRRLCCLTYSIFQMHQMQIKIGRSWQILFCYEMQQYDAGYHLFQLCWELESFFRLVILWGQKYNRSQGLSQPFMCINLS